MAYVQNDAKKLVAYSSVSHLGFVVLGILTLNAQGVQGAHLPDAGPRHLDGRPVPRRRPALRPPPHAPARRVRRPVEADAGVRGLLPGDRAGLGRPARACAASSASSWSCSARSPPNKTWAATGMAGSSRRPSCWARSRRSAVILSAMYLLTMYQKMMFGPLDKPENRDPHATSTAARRWVFGIVVVAGAGAGHLPAADPVAVREVGERVHHRLPRSAAGRAPRARGAGARLPGAAGRGPRPPPAPPPPLAARRRANDLRLAASSSPIAPMLILIGMGCVVLLAETFAAARAARGLAWLGVAGCVAALVARGACSGRDAAEATVALPGDAGRRPHGAVPGRRLHRRGAADAAVRAALPARARLRVRRVLRAGAVRHRRHDDGRRTRPTW